MTSKNKENEREGQNCFFCDGCGKKIELTKIMQFAGRLGGSATSERKATSSAINGRLGGRPKKERKK